MLVHLKERLNLKNDKKPLIIIIIMLVMIIAGLALAQYMFKQVDIQLDKNEETKVQYDQPRIY